MELGPGSSWAQRYGATNGPHGGVNLGSQKGVILAAQNDPRSGVSSMVYLHAGLEIGSAIPYVIHWKWNGDSHVLGSQGSPWPSQERVLWGW